MKTYQVWARSKDQSALLRTMGRILGQKTGWEKMGVPFEIEDVDSWLKENREQYPALQLHLVEINGCPGKVEPDELLDATDTDWNAELDQLVEEEGRKRT